LEIALYPKDLFVKVENASGKKQLAGIPWIFLSYFLRARNRADGLPGADFGGNR
jgi:hypothetical protein